MDKTTLSELPKQQYESKEVKEKTSIVEGGGPMVGIGGLGGGGGGGLVSKRRRRGSKNEEQGRFIRGTV